MKPVRKWLSNVFMTHTYKLEEPWDKVLTLYISDHFERNIVFIFLSISLNIYSKTCLKKPQTTKILMTNGSLMKVKKYCRMLPLDHSAILLTCIKRQLVLKTICGLFESGRFTVICLEFSKEPSQWDISFDHPQYMFWLRNKKIIFIMPSNLEACLSQWPI